MARRKQDSSYRPRGFFFYLGVTFVAVTITGLVAALFLISLPQSLDDVDGLDSVETSGRDVAAVLRESQQRQIPVTLTEKDINRWLARTLEVEQGGMLGGSLEFKQLAVRLTEGQAEVVMVRELAGHTLTFSSFFSVEQKRRGDGLRTEMNIHAGPQRRLPAVLMGGRFGRLVVPQGFLRTVMPAYENLADALAEELESGFSNMVLIRIEDKQISLDPRMPRRSSDAQPGEVD